MSKGESEREIGEGENQTQKRKVRGCAKSIGGAKRKSLNLYIKILKSHSVENK
jgi:hypothetical protein